MPQKLPDWYGIELDASLPDGWTPYEVLIVAKSLDENGVTRFGYMSSKGWSQLELLGAFTAFANDTSIDIHNLMSDDTGGEDDT